MPESGGSKENEPSRLVSTRSIVERCLRGLILACLIANVGLFAWTSVASLLFPYGLNYGEGLVIDLAQRMAAGDVIYDANVREPPYVVDVYPPVYAAVVAGIGLLTRLPFLHVGRAISLAAACVSGLFVAMLARRLTASRFAGLIAATLFLGSVIAMSWAAIARVDMLALALSLAALWLVCSRWQSWPWLATSAILVVASIFTRQTYALAVPLAGAVWLWRHDRRRSLAYAATIAIGCLLVLGVLDGATDGSFYQSVVTANLGSYRVARALLLAVFLLALWPVVVAMAIIGIVRALARRRTRTIEPSVAGTETQFLLWGLLPYTLGALIGSLTVGKLGSDLNYFLELAAALAVWAAIAVEWQPKHPALVWQGVHVVVLCQALWMLAAGHPYRSSVTTRWRNVESDHRLYEQVEAAAARGPVLADDYSTMVVLTGQRLYIDPFMCQQLNAAGRWDPSDLMDGIVERRFPMILLSGPGSELSIERWSRPVLATIDENYKKVQFPHSVAIYVPRETSRSRTVGSTRFAVLGSDVLGW